MRADPWTKEQHDLIVALTGRPATDDGMRPVKSTLDDDGRPLSPVDEAVAQARRGTS